MAQWSVILSVSANSMEVAALGAPDGGATEPQQWFQWMQASEARAELPLGPGNRETYPTGAALALSSARQLAVNEQTMPPFPLLFLLAPDGSLVSFYAMNTAPNAPSLTKPPEPLVAAGERRGNVVVPSAAPAPKPIAPTPVAPTPSQVPKAAEVPATPFTLGGLGGGLGGLGGGLGSLGGGFAASTPLKKPDKQPPPPPHPQATPFAASVSAPKPPAALTTPAAIAPPPSSAKPAEPPAPSSTLAGKGYSSASYQRAIDDEIKSFQRELDQFKAST